MNARKIVPALHNEKLGKVICLLFCNNKLFVFTCCSDLFSETPTAPFLSVFGSDTPNSPCSFQQGMLQVAKQARLRLFTKKNLACSMYTGN